MAMLRRFQPVARVWQERGTTVHAVFDAPPSSASQWTSDFGARMWASVQQNPAGGCRIRVVFGSGGFGQGQPAELASAAAKMLSVGAVPIGIADAILAIEAEFRGAAGWWILAGQQFGVDPSELAAVRGWRLQAETVVGTVRSIDPRRTVRHVAFALGGSLAFIAVFVLASVLLS